MFERYPGQGRSHMKETTVRTANPALFVQVLVAWAQVRFGFETVGSRSLFHTGEENHKSLLFLVSFLQSLFTSRISKLLEKSALCR